MIDGIEPVDRPSESIQFELFEYIYHQILRKDHDWVARDLLRSVFEPTCRSKCPAQLRLARQSAAMLLYTSHEMMLDDLIARPLTDGDLLANANTLIYLGKIRDGKRSWSGAVHLPSTAAAPPATRSTLTGSTTAA